MEHFDMITVLLTTGLLATLPLRADETKKDDAHDKAEHGDKKPNE